MRCPPQIHGPFERPPSTAATTRLLGDFPSLHRLLHHRVFADAAAVAIFRGFVAEVVARLLSIPADRSFELHRAAQNPKVSLKTSLPPKLMRPQEFAKRILHLLGNIAFFAPSRRKERSYLGSRCTPWKLNET